MKEFLSIISKAILIALLCSAVGLLRNTVSSQPLPLIYTRPTEVTKEGVKIPLIDVKQAKTYFDDLQTTFIDTRKEEDYTSAHVKGAVFLNPDTMQDNFPMVQPLLNEDNKIILYCYGPECDMAEEVAAFLGQLGYKKLLIMNSGFRAWEEAGFPVEGSGKDRRSKGGEE